MKGPCTKGDSSVSVPTLQINLEYKPYRLCINYLLLYCCFAGWFNKYQKRWRALGVSWGYGEACVRQSVSYNNKFCNRHAVINPCERVVLFGSMCLPLFIVVASRASTAVNVQCGGCEDPLARSAFRRILAGSLGYMDPSFSLTMYFDPSAKQICHLWVGTRPFCIRVLDNEVDLSEVIAMYEARIIDTKNKKPKQQLKDELLSIREAHCKSPLVVLNTLVALNHYVCSGYTSSLARQYVAQISSLVEKRLIEGFGYRCASGKLHNIDSNTDGHVRHRKLPIYQTRNQYHMKNELSRYKLASRLAFRGCKHISFCGPDGTKVGVDMNLTCAAAMNMVSGKVSVLPPQVWQRHSRAGPIWNSQ